MSEINTLLRRGAGVIPKLPISATKGSIKVRRVHDGAILTCIACTAVLNRVGEIDSRNLFDEFIHRQKLTGVRPDFLFFHSTNPKFRLGKVIETWRDGYNYIAVAKFDFNNSFAIDTAAAIEADPDYWGISIGYRPIGQPELVRTKTGVVEVFNHGENHEISLLPEAVAASYFTKVGLGG